MVRRGPERDAALLLKLGIVDIPAKQALQRRHELPKQRVGIIHGQHRGNRRTIEIPGLRQRRRRVGALHFGLIKRRFVTLASGRLLAGLRLLLCHCLCGGQAFRQEQLIPKIQIEALIAVNHQRRFRRRWFIKERGHKGLHSFNQGVGILLGMQLPARRKVEELHRVAKRLLRNGARETRKRRVALHSTVPRKLSTLRAQTRQPPNLVARVQNRRVLIQRPARFLNVLK
mmetsp:Transcript_17758/g.45077  ORF Transcript_17758/g.45077 Transcript_17758/m.45077 type:complete len:229 (-) Transcript_17758:646-1332(-)